jgi:hypothetical protein
MKTATLAIGLVQLACAACCAVSGFVYHTPWLIVGMTLCASANAWAGPRKVLDALFGDEGLVLDLSRGMHRDTAADARTRAPAARGARMSHPSAGLRMRGAESRLRNCGRRAKT